MDNPLSSIAENKNTKLSAASAMLNNYSTKNTNIKERLNLHVKRRLQDNTDGTVEQGITLSSGSTAGAIRGSETINLSTTKNFENENGNIRCAGGNFNKRSHKLVAPTSAATNIQHTHLGRGDKRSRSKTKHHNNSSSLSSSVEDDCSRDEKPNIANNKSPNATVTTTNVQSSHGGNTNTKEKDSPDLLTWVLNEKKRSLMRNSDVIKYLESIITALSK